MGGEGGGVGFWSALNLVLASLRPVVAAAAASASSGGGWTLSAALASLVALPESRHSWASIEEGSMPSLTGAVSYSYVAFTYLARISHVALT